MSPRTRHYLDYNATAPLRPVVAEVMREHLLMPLNASSIHAEGRRARSLLEASRREIAQAISAFPAELVFTSSGTESNNWVIQSLAHLPCFVAAVEHSSILRAAPNATLLPVDANGVIDRDTLEKRLPQEQGFLVSVQLANNETGVIQPVAEIAQIVHARGGLLHCDAAQALGKMEVDFTALQCDSMTLCGHKMGGPVGAAVLVIKDGISLAPKMVGGGQELNRRAGTENVAAIAGFAEAVKHMQPSWMQKDLRQWLADFEQAALAMGGVIMGQGAVRLPNTVCISMPALNSQTQIMRFDLEGISLSAGAACTSGKVGTSHVLQAMGVGGDIAARAVRISGGWASVQEDIQALTRVWQQLAQGEAVKRLEHKN